MPLRFSRSFIKTEPSLRLIPFSPSRVSHREPGVEAPRISTSYPGSITRGRLQQTPLGLDKYLVYRVFSLFIFVILITSCNPKSENTNDLNFSVEAAPEWTALFHRATGWFGGDGIFAIPYHGVESSTENPNDSILFVFSDTMVGTIQDGELQPGYTMVNNSVALLTGNEAKEENMKFMVASDSAGQPATLFVPNTPLSQDEEYYWLGDGFVNHQIDSNLYIFAYRIRNTHTDDAFPFEETGNALIIVPHDNPFPFKDHRQIDTPFFFEAGNGQHGSLGAGILVNTQEAGAPDPDGYVYVYGVRKQAKELIAARVQPANFEEFDTWEFWDGTSWSQDRQQMALLSDSVSNELSVTPLPNGKYALIYQYAGIFPTIYMQIGETPVGPFGERIKVWDTTRDVSDPDLFTYNAKAHPAISRENELLISYNVNSFKFFEVIEDKPNLYRPRFIRIKFD